MWEDFTRNATVVRLETEEYYVERFITREELEDCTYPRELIRETVRKLCITWQERFGTPLLVIEPKKEGDRWAVYYDNTIDGEVVVNEYIERRTKEIEGGGKDATRGCIEGW